MKIYRDGKPLNDVDYDEATGTVTFKEAFIKHRKWFEFLKIETEGNRFTITLQNLATMNTQFIEEVEKWDMGEKTTTLIFYVHNKDEAEIAKKEFELIYKVEFKKMGEWWEVALIKNAVPLNI